MIKQVVVLGLTIALVGCKSANIISNTSDKSLNLNERQLVKANKNQEADFKTLSARVKIELIKNGSRTASYSANIRMEKDKQILLLSSPISVVKAYLTPEKVRFYNKLDNTYFDGSYDYLSNILGTDITFHKVQRLLLGEPLSPISVKEFSYQVRNNSYVLTKKAPDSLLNLVYTINPSHYKLQAQQITQPLNNRLLNIDYNLYQKVEKQILPQQLIITVFENFIKEEIHLELKSIKLNEDLNFPFNIPSGYKELKLE